MAPSARPLPFVLAATDQGSLIVNRQDYRMVDETSGYGVGYQLLSTASYDRAEVVAAITLLNWRREFFKDGVVALDCGANIGVHTLEWARHMTSWGEVHAFEAQERIFYALAGNIALNNCFNAHAIRTALADFDGTLSIPQPDYTRPGSFGSLELLQSDANEFIGQPIDYRPEALRTVAASRIDSMILQRLDLIKIDVEGMEIAVLNGGRESILRCRPYILVEHLKTGEQALSAFFTSIGYRYWTIGLNFLALPDGDPAIARLVVT